FRHHDQTPCVRARSRLPVECEGVMLLFSDDPRCDKCNVLAWVINCKRCGVLNMCAGSGDPTGYVCGAPVVAAIHPDITRAVMVPSIVMSITKLGELRTHYSETTLG